MKDTGRTSRGTGGRWLGNNAAEKWNDSGGAPTAERGDDIAEFAALADCQLTTL